MIDNCSSCGAIRSRGLGNIPYCPTCEPDRAPKSQGPKPIVQPQDNLSELQSGWMRGLVKVFEYSRIDLGYAFVVLRNARQSYECQRYFRIGSTWDVSVDNRDIELEAALKWLQNQLG